MRFLLLIPFIFLFSCSNETDQKNSYLAWKDSIKSHKIKIRDEQTGEYPQSVGAHCNNPQGAPTQGSVSWNLPDSALSDAEEKITGTWTARLGRISVSPGHKGIVYQNTKGKNVIETSFEAVKKDEPTDQNCAWIDFYDDHTGFWNSCMMYKGGPACMDNIDPFTGERSGSGLRFEWYMEGKKVRMKYEDCFRFPMDVKVNPSESTYKLVTYTVRVKYWDMEITSKNGSDLYTIRDYLPEYKYTSPVKYKYQRSPKTLSGKMGKYKSAVLD
ncbi:MAG: hypothetical protein IAF38_01120 [Bacteroidia bacterium]|nr:hypothetical protein [Bacteroidia bacterium]